MDNPPQIKTNPSPTMKRIGKTIAILLSAELTLQIIAYGSYRSALNKYNNTKIIKNWYTAKPEMTWWLNEMNTLVPEYHPTLGFIFRNIETPNIHIDSRGIRRTTYNTPPDEGNYKKIFLFGGSAMTGYGVKDSETIPSYLAKQFNTPKYKYTFSNYGQIRYNSNQEVLFFIEQLKRGNIPDLVIFYDGFNDAVLTLKTSSNNRLNTIVGEREHADKMGSLSTLFLSGIENTSIIDIKTIIQIGRLLITRIKLLDYPMQFIRRITQLAKTSAGNQTIQIPDSMINDTAINYLQNTRIIQALSQQYGFSYLLFWQPLPQYKHLTEEENNETEIPFYPDDTIIIERVKSALKNKNINKFIDLSDSFAQYSNTSVFMDSIHLSPRGNEIVANVMSSIIETELR